MEALRLLGVGTRRRVGAWGSNIYKVGMVWPLAATAGCAGICESDTQEGAGDRGKAGIIESQLRNFFYDWAGAQAGRMVGKTPRGGPICRCCPGRRAKPADIGAGRGRNGLMRFFRMNNLLKKGRALTEKPPCFVDVPGAKRTRICSVVRIIHRQTARRARKAAIGHWLVTSWRGGWDARTGGYAQMGVRGRAHVVASKLNGGKHFSSEPWARATCYNSGRRLPIRQGGAAREYNV